VTEYFCNGKASILSSTRVTRALTDYFCTSTASKMSSEIVTESCRHSARAGGHFPPFVP
jgi:hypothetical protein